MLSSLEAMVATEKFHASSKQKSCTIPVKRRRISIGNNFIVAMVIMQLNLKIICLNVKKLSLQKEKSKRLFLLLSLKMIRKTLKN